MLERIIIATTPAIEDKAIINLAGLMQVEAFAGSENDVMDRYYQSAEKYKLDTIVRITGDCPLIDPRIVDKVIALYLEEKADYASNTMPETFPDGEDVEVFSLNALRTSWQKAKLTSEREHVTPYMRNNPHLFKIASLKAEFNLSDKRWTVDNLEDFEFVQIIYENLYPVNPLFGMDEILEFVQKHPEVEGINQYLKRNEGYAKSLREDKQIDG